MMKSTIIMIATTMFRWTIFDYVVGCRRWWRSSENEVLVGLALYGSSGGQKWRLEVFICNRGGRSVGR